MTETELNPEQQLEQYRDYLRIIARLQFPSRLQGKLDASDLVQQTLLRAYQRWEQFRGETPEQLAAWLRTILASTLANAVRDLTRAKRNVNLERSLEGSIAQSSARLEAWLSAGGLSPSEQVVRNEQLLEITQQLARLPEPQREALILRHCQGCSLVEIGEQLGRSRAAVASLLRRGLQQLRLSLQEPDE